MEMHKDLPVYLFTNTEAWEKWLKEHGEKIDAIWLKFAKKNTGASSISYDEALDGALCFGWIDGLTNSYNESYYLIRFTPRRAKSIWSKRNREHIERLIKAGRMRSAGMAQVEAAKANGRWDAAYDSAKKMTFPKEFLQELAKEKEAETFYHTLSKANKYAIAFQLQTAVKPETRKRRIKKFLTMLKKGEKLY